mmetsp:Transcript_51752/g.58680  ORF Transcript_51752/g.58680 Transcript_51752/m.58680 type:complete len:316 (+) Transcript_51752:404-1351(+)
MRVVRGGKVASHLVPSGSPQAEGPRPGHDGVGFFGKKGNETRKIRPGFHTGSCVWLVPGPWVHQPHQELVVRGLRVEGCQSRFQGDLLSRHTGAARIATIRFKDLIVLVLSVVHRMKGGAGKRNFRIFQSLLVGCLEGDVRCVAFRLQVHRKHPVGIALRPFHNPRGCGRLTLPLVGLVKVQEVLPLPPETARDVRPGKCPERRLRWIVFRKGRRKLQKSIGRFRASDRQSEGHHEVVYRQVEFFFVVFPTPEFEDPVVLEVRAKETPALSLPHRQSNIGENVQVFVQERQPEVFRLFHRFFPGMPVAAVFDGTI